MEVSNLETNNASELPTLYRDRAFLGITVTQFFGAFNDNLFKQLMMLLAVPIGVSSATEDDQQGIATVIFAAPFVLFSGYAGFLSDRYSKRKVIVCSKVAEIVVMLLGMIAFFAYATTGFGGLLVVLFVMGVQSAFFGPGKYGILPEMLRQEDLPRANGLILMTTFLAIIFGMASAGFLGDRLVEDTRPLVESAPRLAFASLFCIAIAIVGTLTSLLIRRVAAARPKLGFRWDTLAIPADTRDLLKNDRPLLAALLASSMFWFVAAATTPAVNSFGLKQLALNMKSTSLLLAVISIGIAIGSVVAGRVSRGRVDFRLVSYGALGIVVCLLALAGHSASGAHWLGVAGSAIVLTLLGMFAGFFAIPVQVFIQARPPDGMKGRMIAVMNQANFVAMLLAGVVYWLMDRVVEQAEWERCTVFGMLALIMMPVALLYRPKNQDAAA